MKNLDKKMNEVSVGLAFLINTIKFHIVSENF
jgi:hypothetical protein